MGRVGAWVEGSGCGVGGRQPAGVRLLAVQVGAQGTVGMRCEGGILTAASATPPHPPDPCMPADAVPTCLSACLSTCLLTLHRPASSTGGVGLFAMRSSGKVVSKLASPNAPWGYTLCFLNLVLDGCVRWPVGVWSGSEGGRGCVEGGGWEGGRSWWW